ncbi:hypothetical protein TIFTF001_041230 [Ficus carica]|uniref:non-specific serine/threonine protein kinase n=1 Tax=Ficus carica TaxID=3494 RepID=A0AA88CNT9_FICCA|nr:hypothetical protein TIFTF001_041230 [Ficus carica]
MGLAQGDSGNFISIDCGISDRSSYTDETTGIYYLSDTNFTETGENREVWPEYKLQTEIQQFWNVRSFPEGERNCYVLKPVQGKDTRYLIRARFMYGNYDNKDYVPGFDLYLGVDFWDTVNLEFAGISIDKEIIHVPSSDHIYVCLVNTGYGVPFISALELRPLDNQIYLSPSGSGLQLFQRYDFGTASNQATRYKDDVYDRLWSPSSKDIMWMTLNNSLADKNSLGKTIFEPPLAVLSTAYTPNGNDNGNNMGFNWKPQNSTSPYYFYMHFAELQELDNNQSREFKIYINEDLWSPGPIPLDQYYLRIVSVISSTSDPIITPDSEGKIQSTYRVERNWQGDPCAPKAYLWDGLDCSYDAKNPPQIISLDLSSSGLKGEISPYIADLTMIQYLDLSNNSLNGKVPEVLAQLTSLRVLNLQRNNLTGPIPDALLKRSNNGLSLSIDKNLNPLCPPGSCGKKKNKKFIIPVVGSVCGIFVLLIVLIWGRRIGRKLRKESNGGKGSIFSRKQHFKYSEIQRMTNNFQRVLGEGGFGEVYHGHLKGNEVAVKMLSSSSLQGHRQFHAELKLLLRVHHKNLTTLVGYCNEGTNVGLIYEYMAMGNLRSHLSDNSTNILSWEDRLRIAIDTAQGLEYLHNGCKPPIVHRDVKSTNILLNEKLQAKLSDFGLSKIFPNEGGAHFSTSDAGTPGVSTSVAGTPGYLDPEIQGDFDANTVWKAVEIAMACVAPSSRDRPTMNRVATELKDCLTTDLRNTTGKDVSEGATSRDYSVEMLSSNPQAR